MRHHHSRLGELIDQPLRPTVDGLHTVVHPEHLPAPEELAADGAERHPAVVRTDEREDGLPVLGRRVQHAHVTDAGERHLEGPRDRGRCHRQHVYLGAELLQSFLVPHAEPLFLVHHH